MTVSNVYINEIDRMIERDVALAPFTTMGVGGAAEYFSRVKNEEQLVRLVRWSRSRCLPRLVLGHGSNVVISDRGVPGLVMKMEIPGIMRQEEDKNVVIVEVGAGECWDTFVDYTVKNGWWGIENMSLIPGTVGAVAIQNVSAYGQESRNVILRVRAYDTRRDEFSILSRDECRFGFRSSIFNTAEVGRYIIVSIVFRLSKQGKPRLSRRNVVRTLQTRRDSRVMSRSFRRFWRLAPTKKLMTDCSQSEIRDAIIHLRTHGGLLPAPNTVGNAGTFFKASVVPHPQSRRIALKCLRCGELYSAMKILACRWLLSSAEGVKIPSKILIRGSKLQHISRGGISLLPTNCAVVINSCVDSSSEDILELIRILRRTIYEKTGVALPVEPSLVGFSRDEIDRTFDVLH